MAESAELFGLLPKGQLTEAHGLRMNLGFKVGGSQSSVQAGYFRVGVSQVGFTSWVHRLGSGSRVQVLWFGASWVSGLGL